MPCNGTPIQLNGNILITCTILKCVVASTAKAELGTIFLDLKEARDIRLILEELGHPKPSTRINIDDTVVVRMVNSTTKKQRSRLTEMRYLWLLDQALQKYFKF